MNVGGGGLRADARLTTSSTNYMLPAFRRRRLRLTSRRRRCMRARTPRQAPTAAFKRFVPAVPPQHLDSVSLTTRASNNNFYFYFFRVAFRWRCLRRSLSSTSGRSKSLSRLRCRRSTTLSSSTLSRSISSAPVRFFFFFVVVVVVVVVVVGVTGFGVLLVVKQ